MKLTVFLMNVHKMVPRIKNSPGWSPICPKLFVINFTQAKNLVAFATKTLVLKDMKEITLVKRLLLVKFVTKNS